MVNRLVFLLSLFCSFVAVAQNQQPSNNEDVLATPSKDSTIKPLLPDAQGDTLIDNRGLMPFGSTHISIDSMRRRMVRAYDYDKKVDSMPFRPLIIKHRQKYHNYMISMYSANMLIQYKYTKSCSKKTITKDCLWREWSLPYLFVDSVRSVMYGEGYLIFYKNLQSNPSKVKLLISRSQINTIAKVIKDRRKVSGKQVDSTFAMIYKESWKKRQKKILKTLNNPKSKKKNQSKIIK